MTDVLKVALPLPLHQLYDYLPPPNVDFRTLMPGVRVRVLFAGRKLIGVVVKPARSTLPVARLRPIIEVLDPYSLFTKELWESLQWAARYWQHPLGEVFAAALPRQLREDAETTVRGDFGVKLRSPPADVTALRAGSAPRQLYEILQAGARTWQELKASLPQAASALRRLEKLGLVERVVFDDSPRQALIAPPPLNPAQQAAVISINAALSSFCPFLLEGVTGSGKTEVYLAVIETVLARGKQVLVLVPEIGLTPQLLARFRERLPAPVLALHSGLSEGERARAWQRVRKAVPLVLIGTRSAVFAPHAALGLVVIDEEHDTSFKQQDGFRYHARDLALVRAQKLGIPVIMGSATPSLESLHNANNARYQRLLLIARAGFAKPPRVELLDLRRQSLREGLSTVALAAIRQHLDRREQVLVFKNRRGYSPLLHCRSCGWRAECDRCDRPYTWHRRRQRLMCHPCGRECPAPAFCPVCGEQTSPLGIGTERLEDLLNEQFSDVPVIRVDRDSTRGRAGLEKLLARAHGGDSCLLIGTQMLAKGHDLPNLTLAVIVDADGGLFSQDFRAGERMAQLIVQVAGRSGRSHKPGTVLIQTHYPEHPLFSYLLTGGYSAFAEAELKLRETLAFPPFTAMALLQAEAHNEKPLIAFFAAFKNQVNPHSLLRVIGPMPAAHPKRAGQIRWQLLLQANNRRDLQTELVVLGKALYDLPENKQVRWSLDVDPISMD